MRNLLAIVVALAVFAAPVCFAQEKAEGETINVTIKGLVCDFCVRAIEKTFEKRDDVSKVDVDLDKALLTIQMKPGKTMDDETIKGLIADAGYEVEDIRR